MKLVIQGKNIDITDAIREHVDHKVTKAVSHFNHLLTQVDVHLSVARNPRINPTKQTAEVTMYVNGSVVRAQESSENLYASIDLVADKISRQLRKYKEKRQERVREPLKEADALVDQPSIATTMVADREPALPAEDVRMKYFAMPPMTIEQARAQLQLIDHDFYMFRNAETDAINVIYERSNHGGFGVIQPRNGPASYHNGQNGQNGHDDQQVIDFESFMTTAQEY
jgi:putative sigma-54 modulation protein